MNFKTISSLADDPHEHIRDVRDQLNALPNDELVKAEIIVPDDLIWGFDQLVRLKYAGLVSEASMQSAYYAVFVTKFPDRFQAEFGPCRTDQILVYDL